MEAWNKNGISDMQIPPPLERYANLIELRMFNYVNFNPFRRKFREKNRAKAHSIVGTPNYIGMIKKNYFIDTINLLLIFYSTGSFIKKWLYTTM